MGLCGVWLPGPLPTRPTRPRGIYAENNQAMVLGAKYAPNLELPVSHKCRLVSGLPLPVLSQ